MKALRGKVEPPSLGATRSHGHRSSQATNHLGHATFLFVVVAMSMGYTRVLHPSGTGGTTLCALMTKNGGLTNPGGVWTPLKGRHDVHSQVPFSDWSNHILDVALDRSIKNGRFLALPLVPNMTHASVRAEMGTSPRPFGRPREPSSTPTWWRRTEPWSPTTAKAAAPFPCAYVGYGTSALLPTGPGGTNWAQHAACEASLAVSTDADPAFSEHAFWLHRSAVAPDPLRPPSIGPPPAAAAAGDARRTAVQLKKQFAAHDSIAEFREATEEGFELNGWDNATKKQRTHELLNNVHPYIALALVTDGAKDMDTIAAFALMATLPQPRQKLVSQQPEVARPSATGGEPWTEFASKLHYDIVCSRGHSTIAMDQRQRCRNCVHDRDSPTHTRSSTADASAPRRRAGHHAVLDHRPGQADRRPQASTGPWRC